VGEQVPQTAWGRGVARWVVRGLICPGVPLVSGLGIGVVPPLGSAGGLTHLPRVAGESVVVFPCCGGE